MYYKSQSLQGRREKIQAVRQKYLTGPSKEVFDIEKEEVFFGLKKKLLKKLVGDTNFESPKVEYGVHFKIFFRHSQEIRLKEMKSRQPVAQKNAHH